MAHITKRGSKYTFQLHVPKDVRHAFGNRALIKQALGTADRIQATVTAGRLLEQYSVQFEAVRNGAKLEQVNAQLEPMGFYRLNDGEDIAGALRGLAANEANKAAWVQQQLPSFLGMCVIAGIELSEEHWQKLENAGGLLRSNAARFGEILRDALPDASLDITEVRRPAVVGEVTSLRTLFHEWVEKRKPAPSSARECLFSVDRFEELHGVVPIEEITPRHIGEFIAAIEQFPTNLSNADAALTLPQILTKFKGVDRPRSSPVTVEKRFGFVRTLLKRAVGRRLIPSTPTEGFRIADTDKQRVNVRPFSPADLKTIFSSPYFMKCAEARDTRFWLAIAGLFTGARQGEILQVESSDVRPVEGGTGYLIAIHDEDGKRVKNETSIRYVPVHRDLERLGFVEWAKSRKGRLFGDLIPTGPDADISDWASKRMNYWIDKAGVIDPGKRFHSFRHLAKDRAREAELDEELRDALFGHENGSVGRDYGEGFSERRLEDAMNRLTWPVDLSHLMPLKPPARVA